MNSTYAEGPNFAITVEDGVATCRIWARPDLSWAEGAGTADTIAKALQALAAGPRDRARGLVLDERQAPPVVGPRTEAAIGELLSAWERRGRRVAYALGNNPVKSLQMRRLMAQWTPKHGRAFATIEEAHAWACAADADTPLSTKLPTPPAK
ncbi:MAG TPA: hypothetical protein VFS00_26385 [Polyangiaceae bacterium]|nr:hypothetical protein [Polyangiaceae bacterium]